MARVRVPTTSSNWPRPVCIFFCAFSNKPPNTSNSFFTVPNTCHTSLLRFCKARVLKPICRLLSMAIRVVGPATVILYSVRNWSINELRLITSAYILSKGRNIIAKSVVLGGSRYLSLISFAIFLITVSKFFVAVSISSGIALSYAASKCS